jgi:hypothetical protein
MASNLGVACSLYAFKVCVNGVTEARKILRHLPPRHQLAPRNYFLSTSRSCRLELPISGTQLGEYDRGDGCCNASKFYDELDGWVIVAMTWITFPIET